MSFHEEQDHFSPFKKYEYILNNKNETFENKIASLIEVWKSIAELDLPEFDMRHVIQIMDWAKLHALNIVLTAEWNKFKDKYQDRLLEEIEKAQNELLKLNDVFATPCKKLADVVRNPWEDTTLMKLMKEKDAEIGEEEIEFFCVETAYLVSVRLKKLCESQCEDLALNLVTAFMNCNKLSKSQNFTMNATETQMWFIFDVYIALLYKFQEKQKMVALLKELSFEEGLQLVKRFAKKRVKIAKIWKNCQRIAIFAIQMYISQAVLKYSSDLQATLEQYIELYISLCNTGNLQDFSNSIRRISNLADAAGLYVFCDVVQRKAGQKLKPFTIEMYIRALTTDMNELERQKDANDTEKVEIITQRLADAFVNLADFLDEHVNVARECVLTAFSLAPTGEKLKKIEELAKRSGFEVISSELEWKCRLHPPALPSDEITWICPECGDWMCKPTLNLPKINMALHEALQNSVLGISEALCDDLVVCLSNPRYQILSWFLPWNDLHRLCRMYLQNPQNTKNFVTELKFVDIDYSIFKDIKREPLDELAGIERGYEQYLDHNFVSDEESISDSEDSMSQDSRPYSLGSDGAGDSLFLPLLPTVSPKSDPDTLKSLRMFRPTLKRIKEKDPGESTPEKVFKPCTIVGESQASTSDKNLSYGSSEGQPSTTSTLKAPTDDSKNVKTATLPQLGGQVARTEIKATSVHQELTLKELLLSTSVDLVRREPHKLSKGMSFTESVNQTLNQEIQNKPLLIGSNGSSKQTPFKEVKVNRPDLSSRDMEIMVKIPKKESDLCRQILQSKNHPPGSVLPNSKVETSIQVQSLDQTSNVDNQCIPPLVVKPPLLSNPSHPKNKTTVLSLQDKLRANALCISTSTQQTEAIGESRLQISTPLSVQQETNSRLSATQLKTYSQPKLPLSSQQKVTPHLQTSSKQISHCQTEASSENSASLLQNQLMAPVAANSQNTTNVHPPPVRQYQPSRQRKRIIVHSIHIINPKEVNAQTDTTVVTKSQSEVPRQTPVLFNIQPRNTQATSVLPEQNQQSHLNTLPRTVQPETPSTSHQLTKVQETPLTDLQKERFLESLRKLEALQLQKAQLAQHLQAAKQAALLQPTSQAEGHQGSQPPCVLSLTTGLCRTEITSQQRSFMDTNPQIATKEINSSTPTLLENCLVENQSQLTSSKSQETNLLTKVSVSPPRHLQITVKASPTTQIPWDCPTELNPIPQQESPPHITAEDAYPPLPSVQEECQIESQSTLTFQEINHLQPESRVTCQRKPQTTVEISSLSQLTVEENCQREGQLLSTVHRSQETSTLQVGAESLPQQASPLDSHPQTPVEVVSQVHPTSQEYQLTYQSAAHVPQETNLSESLSKAMPISQQVSPSEYQTIVGVDSPSPPTSEKKCQLDNQHQLCALTYQETSPVQTAMNSSPRQTFLLDSHLQPIVEIVRLDLSTLPKRYQLNIQISPETNQPETMGTCQRQASLDSHPSKMLKEVSPSPSTSQEQYLAESQGTPVTPEWECLTPKVHLSHQQQLPLDNHLQTSTEISCSQLNLQEMCLLDSPEQLLQESQLDSQPQAITEVSCLQPQLSRLPQLRVVISPNTQLRLNRFLRRRRCRLSTGTVSPRYQMVKKKTRNGKKKRSRGRPRKNPPSTHRINPPSILQKKKRPSTRPRYSPQPENTYKVCLMLTEPSAQQKPSIFPKVQKPASQSMNQHKSPAHPSTSQVSRSPTPSPRRIRSSLSLIASIRKEEWPTVPPSSCSDDSSEEETDRHRAQKGKLKLRRRRSNMFDASRILHDFFSRRRTQSPEQLPPPIHTHSKRYPSSVMQIQQMKSKNVPYLVEEDEDLSCLRDPTRKRPTIAILSGQVCLFHHKRLRVGRGVPSMIYQRTVETQKKYLEIWSSGSSEEEESELELEMEDAYRLRSAILVIEEHPRMWAMWIGQRSPRPRGPPQPPSPHHNSKTNKSSAKGKRKPPKRSHKAQSSSSYTRPTGTTSSTRTVTDHWNYQDSNTVKPKRQLAARHETLPRVHGKPLVYVDHTQSDDSDEYEEMREKRRMRKARRIIRREKAEEAIVTEMKRMSDLAFEQLINGKPEDPPPEVVDLDFFIEFLKNRGLKPLKYAKLGGFGRTDKRKESNKNYDTAVTKELTVNLCRLSFKQLRELGSKTDRAKLPGEYNSNYKAKDKVEKPVSTKENDSSLCHLSMNELKMFNKSCDAGYNDSKFPAKGEDEMPFGKGDNDSDLENSNVQNNDHESKQKASCDVNQLDKRVPRVLLENISVARSLLANVPGLNDFHLMQPQNVDHIVNVVQVSGHKTQIQSSSQTSTPVTAHIQRVGQPRPSEQKPENSAIVASSSPATTNNSNVMPSGTTGSSTPKSQPSTLINILSQQVIRPANIVPSSSTITGNSNGHKIISNTSSNGNNSTSSCGNSSSTTTPTRRPPFINILSQQIIRPTQASKGPPNNGAYTVTETVLPKPPITEPISSTVNNLTRPTITTTTVIPKTTSIVTTSQGITSGNISSSVPDNASNTPGTTVGNTQGSTIVQFICKSALPKFQQAFGKTVYQCTAETTEPSSVSESSNSPAATICTIPASTVTPSNEIKKNVTNITKTVPVNVQSIQGNVIYSRQVPVGQTINLVPPTGATRQVFRIAASNPEQLNLVKDSVIHSKMSALLAAALQSRPKNTETEIQVQDDGTKITLTRPALVQNARIVKPVQLQLPSNVVRAPQPNLSSTTLEQLREFDMVYKQIKERSSNTTPTEISSGEQTQEAATPQRISVTYVNQLPKYTQLSPVVVVSSYSHLQQAATSPALSVTSQSSLSPCTTPTSTPSSAPKITTKTTKGKTFKNHTNNSTTKTSPISKPQQKPQEDEHTTQRIFDILAEYAEQLRNSPDLNNKPAPRRRSNPPTNPSQNSKRKKSSSSTKKTAPTNSNVDIDTDDITVGSEDSSGGGIVQLSVTDDEQSQSQAAATSTVESSEATTPNCPRQVILTDNSSVGSQPRNVIIADSSVGEALKMSNTAVIVPGSYIMPVSMVKGGQQIAVMSGGSKILATVPARSGQNMLLFQSFTNQNRKGAISAVKYSSLQSLSGISSQSIAGVSAQPPVILPSNSVATAVAIGQQMALKKIGEERDGGEVLLAISQKEDTQPDSVTSVSSDSEDVKIPDQSTVKVDHHGDKILHTYQKPISTNKSATTVIATSISTQKLDQEPCAQPTVISTTKVSTTLNGPMLSHTTGTRFRKASDSERSMNRGSEAKDDSTHNGAKVTNAEPKTYRNSAIYYTNKAKKVSIESQKPESDAQKQAMLERELRLQKSLSEECEDLGVDEPSTSDLFPEADLLFDSNHSPSFDQNSQEGVKKGPHGTEKEEGTKSSINLFSDDDNSSSLKSDLFEYVEYHTVESALDHQAKQLMNGNNPETESSSCEDNTLLPKCTNMSEVTLNSPISPEVYAESSVNKYKFKYTNRKKSEKIKQSDSGGETITNSEDAVSSADSCKLSSEEESYKVVHVALTKADMTKEENRCELHVCDEFVDSPSGRGARRSVRKLCSCCNGAQDGHHAARKRPNPSRPQTPATPHKKPFLKKR